MGTHRLIYIRTDGNAKIASGHLVRCFSVALACRKLGMEVHFLVSDSESCLLLAQLMGSDTDFSITQLETASYDSLEQELPEVLSILSSHNFDSSLPSGRTSSGARKPVFLLDSYYVTEHYLLSLWSYAQTAYLDDLRLFDYPADLVINYDVIPEDQMASYKTSYANAGQLLLGASYAPLRSQFQNRQTHLREKASDILVTTGGSDPLHFCLRLVSQIADLLQTSNSSCAQNHMLCAGKNFHIVIGKMNEDKENLYRLAKELPFLTLHENVQDMADLMSKCDLAVSAAGTTLYELCALGIPTISFIISDNQLDCAGAFDRANAIPCAGDLRVSADEVFQKIFQFIEDTAALSGDSCAKRKAMHHRMTGLVDGNGAARIAHALFCLCSSEKQTL